MPTYFRGSWDTDQPLIDIKFVHFVDKIEPLHLNVSKITHRRQAIGLVGPFRVWVGVKCYWIGVLDRRSTVICVETLAYQLGC